MSPGASPQNGSGTQTHGGARSWARVSAPAESAPSPALGSELRPLPVAHCRTRSLPLGWESRFRPDRPVAWRVPSSPRGPLFVWWLESLLQPLRPSVTGAPLRVSAAGPAGVGRSGRRPSGGTQRQLEMGRRGRRTLAPSHPTRPLPWRTARAHARA